MNKTPITYEEFQLMVDTFVASHTREEIGAQKHPGYTLHDYVVCAAQTKVYRIASVQTLYESYLKRGSDHEPNNL